MKAKIFVGAGACVIAILALVAAWQGFTEIRFAGRARATIARNQAAFLSSQRQARAAAEAAAAPAGAPAPAATGESGRAPAPRGKAPSVAALLAADPRLMALYLKSFRAGLPDRYGTTYARLGLSPAMIDKFEEIATAQEGDNMDLQAAAEAQGLPNNDPGIAAMRRQSNHDFQAKVAALAASAGITPTQLNDEKALASQPLQNLIGNVATAVALTPTPLTYAQAGRLAPILAAASPTFQANGSVDRSTLDWDKAVAQAAGVLSPAQLQGLQTQADVSRVQTMAKQFYLQEHPAP